MSIVRTMILRVERNKFVFNCWKIHWRLDNGRIVDHLLHLTLSDVGGSGWDYSEYVYGWWWEEWGSCWSNIIHFWLVLILFPLTACPQACRRNRTSQMPWKGRARLCAMTRCKMLYIIVRFTSSTHLGMFVCRACKSQKKSTSPLDWFCLLWDGTATDDNAEWPCFSISLALSAPLHAKEKGSPFLLLRVLHQCKTVTIWFLINQSSFQ
jgi:hypothetical protein